MHIFQGKLKWESIPSLGGVINYKGWWHIGNELGVVGHGWQGFLTMGLVTKLLCKRVSYSLSTQEQSTQMVQLQSDYNMVEWKSLKGFLGSWNAAENYYWKLIFTTSGGYNLFISLTATLAFSQLFVGGGHEGHQACEQCGIVTRQVIDGWGFVVMDRGWVMVGGIIGNGDRVWHQEGLMANGLDDDEVWQRSREHKWGIWYMRGQSRQHKVAVWDCPLHFKLNVYIT